MNLACPCKFDLNTDDCMMESADYNGSLVNKLGENFCDEIVQAYMTPDHMHLWDPGVEFIGK